MISPSRVIKSHGNLDLVLDIKLEYIGWLYSPTPAKENISSLSTDFN